MENINKENYGRIHSIESFGTVDGPGIRYVIFLQGCALRCKYCHNRDTWDINSGELRSVDDLVNRIESYKAYILPSNGGVTVTGGEPLLQVKFVTNLFKRLKQQGIHTAIDTSGMFEITEDIKELLKYTDLVLLDIKHINDEKCKELVGHSNKRELEFAKYLSDNNIKIWIRQVLVPGITDDTQDLIDLRMFIKSLRTVEKVEILPYHDMGKHKWINLGYEYQLENIRPANAEDVKRAKELLGL